MDTGAIRPYVPVIHDPPVRRDDAARSAVVTDLPVEKTVRAARAAEAATSSGGRSDRETADRPTITTGFERDLSSGSIVYRWTDETIGRVILEIPRSDKIRSRQAYEGHAAPDAPAVDRSV